MADTRILLAGLEEYRASVRRHLIELRTEFSQLENRWYALSGVYEGDSADQFRAGWTRTTERFHEYVQRAEAINAVLDERIDYLREVNRTDSTIG